MNETRPFDDPRLAAALRELDRYDAIVFTSANAVRSLAGLLEDHGRMLGQLRARVLCVGPGTASAARRAGFAAPEVPASRYDAESLAEAVRDVLPPAGKRFLFPCGSLSRPTLPQSLREAGARVDEVIVYATAPADVDAAQLRAILVRAELDALTFASPSAVRRFAACLDEASHAAASRAVIAAIGVITAEALAEVGSAGAGGARARRCAGPGRSARSPFRGASARRGRMSFPMVRMRRLRRSEALRRLVRETRITRDDLVLPLFAVPGSGVREAVASMPGVFRFSADQIAEEAKAVADLGIPADPALRDSRDQGRARLGRRRRRRHRAARRRARRNAPRRNCA